VFIIIALLSKLHTAAQRRDETHGSPNKLVNKQMLQALQNESTNFVLRSLFKIDVNC